MSNSAPKLSLDSIVNNPSLISWESAESIVADLKADVLAFVDAVEWSEPLFKYLAAYHIAIFMSVVLFWWNKAAASTLGFLFLTFMTATVLCSEYINSFASVHHKHVSEIDYFDKNGAFITTVFSGPMMLNILLFLFAMVREVGQLLVVSKRQQLGLNKKKQLTATKVESEGDNKGEGKKAAAKTPGSDRLRQRKGAK